MAVRPSATAVAALIAGGDLVINDGYRAKNAELSKAGLPFARGANINNGFKFDDADFFPEEDLERVGEKVSEPGDVVFTSKGTVGRFAFVDQNTTRFVYSPQLCFWRSRNRRRIDPGWLFYWMQSGEFRAQYESVSGQTDMAAYVNLRDQRQMMIALPPISEQRAIAHVLGTLDDKIELNRRMNETLEGIARALFKSWFVDFLPVRAKQRARTQTGDPVRAKLALSKAEGAEGRDTGLPPHITELFPDRLEPSDLGEIPAGWEVRRLDDLLLLQRGFDLPTTERTAGRYPVVSAGGISGSHNESSVKGPGVVTGRSGVIGNVLLLLVDFWPLNTTLWVKEFRVASPIFAYHLLLRLDLPAFNAGSAVPTLNRNHIHDLTALVPPRNVVAEFEALSMPLYEKRDALVWQNESLAAVRDAMLPKLISGEVRVKDAEWFAEEAV